MKLLNVYILSLLLILGGCGSKTVYVQTRLDPLLFTPLDKLPEPVYYIDFVKHYEQAEVAYRQACNIRLEDLKNEYTK